MAAMTRVYIVTQKVAEDGKEHRRLVRATHPSHALRHVADSQFQVTTASQDDLIDCLKKGIEVETIKAEQTELTELAST
jgi:hypothetical protein